MRKQTIPITIELPLELAEFLSLHGNQVIQAVQNAVNEAKRSTKAVEWSKNDQNRQRERQERLAKIARDGRTGHRALRKRLRDDLEGFKGKERAAKRKVFIDEIATDLGLFPDYLEFAIRKHRNALRRRIRDRRHLWITRYLIQGHSNNEIALRIRGHISTVALAVRDIRLEAREAGQTLEELERSKSRKRKLSNTGTLDKNVIQWADIKAARGDR